MEGTNCAERALLPEKALREKLNQVIEDDFSKATLVSTIKYFKAHSGKQCVDATTKIMEYVKRGSEVPKQYKTLLREIRKDSPISSWLPSYSQRDTKLWFFSLFTFESISFLFHLFSSCLGFFSIFLSTGSGASGKASSKKGSSTASLLCLRQLLREPQGSPPPVPSQSAALDFCDRSHTLQKSHCLSCRIQH